MRNAWANAVALRSEKSVGCTIERKALIAIAYRKTALHTTGGRAALHCMGEENMRDVPALGRNFLLLAYPRWAAARLAMSAEFLAARGYIVFALNHYRANTYDSTIAYLANKLWQRPRDISLTISYLLSNPSWGRLIDASRIGVAGHSQGGFTALWVAGTTINPEKYLAFQRAWRNNQMVPDYLRNELPLDASPALDVHDKRIKAAFAMAPGIVQAFGMDEAGLRQLKVPAYITVGAADTQAPPAENAEFAARHAEHAELHVIPGRVDHDIFVNES